MEENEILKREIKEKQIESMNVKQSEQMVEMKKQYRNELDRAH